MNRTSSGDSHPLESHDNVAERPASRGESGNLIKRVEATAAVGLVDADTWKALPYLLKLARATDELVAIDCEGLPEEAVAGPDGRCAICTVRAAREPLFRPEVPSCPSQG